MRWEDLPESRTSRTAAATTAAGGGGGRGGGGIPGGAGGLSIGTILLLGLIGYATGIDPGLLISGVEQFYAPAAAAFSSTARAAEAHDPPRRRRTRPANSSSASSAAAKSCGRRSSPRKAAPIAPPVLVLYSGQTHANCGGRADARWGRSIARPTCASISIPRSSSRSRRRFKGCDVGSPACRFAQAYVIAHEVGHHVQNLLGILQRSRRCSSRRPQQGGRQPHPGPGRTAGRLLRRHLGQPLRERLEPGDIEAALRTAAAIGDDALQRQAQGRVVPDSFTHGTLGAAPALVQQRLQAGHGRQLQHLRGDGAALGGRCARGNSAEGLSHDATNHLIAAA